MANTGISYRQLVLDLARVIRQIRQAHGWTQAQLAERAAISRAMVAKVEAGRANVSLQIVGRLVDALGIRAEWALRTPFIDDRPQRDFVHTTVLSYIERRYRRLRWPVAREVEIVHGRSHGWIDLLAFEPVERTVVVHEVKTEVDDLGRVERTLGWYEREAWTAARRLGWKPNRILGCLTLLDTERVHDQLRANRLALATGFPLRASGHRPWIAAPPDTATAAATSAGAG